MNTDILKKAEADRAVDTLLRLLGGAGGGGGVDAFEIYMGFEKGFAVEVKDGAIDSLKVRSQLGVGLRTIADGRPGFAYSTVMAKEALEDMVVKALSGSRGTTPDRFLSFPAPPLPPRLHRNHPVRSRARYLRPLNRKDPGGGKDTDRHGDRKEREGV